MTAPAQTARTAARKPRPKPERFARVLKRFDNGQLLVEVEERFPRSSKLTHYYVHEIPAQFGRGFHFAKFASEGGETHDCNVGDEQGAPACCDCKGHERFGYCRHVSCARALIAAGKLS
jgi:hypothetical protein